MNPNEISQLLENSYLIFYFIAIMIIIAFLYVIYYKIKLIIAKKINKLFLRGISLIIDENHN